MRQQQALQASHASAYTAEILDNGSMISSSSSSSIVCLTSQITFGTMMRVVSHSAPRVVKLLLHSGARNVCNNMRKNKQITTCAASSGLLAES